MMPAKSAVAVAASIGSPASRKRPASISQDAAEPLSTMLTFAKPPLERWWSMAPSGKGNRAFSRSPALAWSAQSTKTASVSAGSRSASSVRMNFIPLAA